MGHQAGRGGRRHGPVDPGHEPHPRGLQRPARLPPSATSAEHRRASSSAPPTSPPANDPAPLRSEPRSCAQRERARAGVAAEQRQGRQGQRQGRHAWSRSRPKNGTLTEVALNYRGVTRAGKQIKGTVAGTLSADKTSWTAGDRLEPSSTYTLTMTGKGASGKAETEKSSFRTAQLSADQETYADDLAAGRLPGRPGHAGRPELRRPGQGQGELREAPARPVHPRPGGHLELALEHAGPLPAEDLVEAGHEGQGVGRHQRSRRGQRGLRAAQRRAPTSRCRRSPS